MQARTIAYWTATLAVAGILIGGGATDFVRTPYVRGVMEQLGYPAYFAVIIGFWKMLGGAAILIPRFPRLKEWAYAGAVFNFTGAAASHLAVGDSIVVLAPPLVCTGLALASWALRPPTRRLEAARGLAAANSAASPA